ncbi:hypothetical protein F0562_028651 [Nyssa sinensis]|uniref:Carboxypeptidase n=1 Tax=Nyssa sinensis TaxID=561372 RepID=A0A5J5AYS3_9ASTE|nr:hypothetical protein F0562_028651 [Nyssa sinensis]
MEDDLIEGGLPGQPSGVMFKQYAGYITVDKSKGRSLFYYFAEAVHNPSSSPLILWLNGGPGCSSLGVGAMALDSPTLMSTSDYNTSGDMRTAQDTYIFLINWFKRYPHYKARDFYIMGESYSGFYIPELSDYIIKRNVQAHSSSKIQLQGIMIGNGIMNDVTDLRGLYDFVWSHALISDETHGGLIEHCKNSSSPQCDHFEERMGTEAGQIDFYNIYSPVCFPSSNSSRKLKRFGGYDPCEENYVYMYLNLPQVQEALHANRTKLPYTWEFCSSNLINSWKDSPTTMFPVYRRLIASGLRILLYSGDVDAVVPVSGTRYSIDALNLKVIEPWHPWSDDKEEVAGYRVAYDGLTFTTIRGAGHEVPRFQPRRALALLKTFLAAK